METTTSVNSAKEAIKVGFSFFEDFFGKASVSHVLLEGVEFSESGDFWVVTIGFDVGRSKVKTSSPLFGDRVDEPLREKRFFEIDRSTGNLKRMR